MKNEILKLTALCAITAAVFISCNNNNAGNGSADSSNTANGMGTVQTDSTDNDTVHTHSGMKDNNTEVKK